MTGSPISSSRRILFLLVLILVAYGAVACALALTKRPWCDEICFANPGVDLITRGSFGVTTMDPTGYGIFIGWYFPHVQTHAYFIMPFDPLLQAAWFKLFGVHVFTMRSLHVFLGLLALLAWGLLVHRLSRSTPIALVAMAMIALDRGFLQAASDGRGDMASAAFGVIGLAAYIVLRERRLGWALFAANAGLTAAVLCHPNGAIAGLGLLYLVLRLDRRRLEWRHLAICTVPYLIGFGLWGWYISLDPQAFRAQFTANASTGRFGGLINPLLGIWREISVRYLEVSYLPSYAHGWRKLPVLIPCLYAAGILACCFAPRLRRVEGARLFGWMAALYFLAFSIGEGTKAAFYLVHMTPLFCCTMAFWVITWWESPAWRRKVVAASAAMLLIFEPLWAANAIYRNSYRDSYLAVTQFIKQHASPGALTMGAGELAFELGFYGPTLDDVNLGYFSGRHPDFVVIDEKCYGEHLNGLEARNPEVYHHVMKVLHEDCERVFTSGTTEVYARKGLVR
jgi:hypothetical protein